MLLKKIIKKIFLHFSNPILAIKFDIRKLYYTYCYFKLKFVYNVTIPIEKRYFVPDYCDLYNLFNIIIKHKPRKSIEVGSGYSTFIIMKALEINEKKHNITPYLVSIEQDDEYLAIHKNYLKENLNKNTFEKIKLIKTDLKIETIKNTSVSICSNFPHDNYNFFYEDRTDDNIFKIAGDAIKIESSMPKNFIICVDGMIDTVKFYKQNLTRDYHFSGGFFHGNTWIPKKI